MSDASTLTSNLIGAIAADRDRWMMRAIAAERQIAAAPTRNPMPPSHELVAAARIAVYTFNDINSTGEDIYRAVVRLENALERLPDCG